MPNQESALQRKTAFFPIHRDSHFPLENLPYGIFRENGDPSVGVAIGDFVLDLARLQEAGLLEDCELPRKLFATGSLNPFMALGRPAWKRVRAAITNLLDGSDARLKTNDVLCAAALRSRDQVSMLLPAEIGDYTDFYSSKEHATNVGTMFRGADNALMPNWLHLPVGYHGRSSSIVVDGTPVRRPQGQMMPPGADAPIFGASKMVDFELEMAFFIGPGSELGTPINIQSAEDHIFGMCLVNDWSARDIQKWEYVPLGPFTAKNFCTTISPWIVTLEALEPFRAKSAQQDPLPLPYLRGNDLGTYDIQLQVLLNTGTGNAPELISETNFSRLYWSMAQQLAHQTVTGCNVRTGDMIASGTISGPTPDSLGSLLEIAWKGERPITLRNGDQRASLQDDDILTITGYCQGDGFRVGFGEASGRLMGARA